MSVLYEMIKLNKLKKLYPDVSTTTLKKRLNACETSFHRFRSFIPYYYDFLREQTEVTTFLGDLSLIKGMGVGDAHPLNFGSVLTKNKKFIFTMNDPDDGGECPLIFDFLRFCVSAELFLESFRNKSKRSVIKNTSFLIDLFQSYENGLLNKKTSFSKPLRSWIKKKSKLKKEMNESYLDRKSFKEGIFKFSRDLPNISEVEKKLQKRFIKKIHSKNKWIKEIYDIIAYQKWRGGSGGLTRFSFLVSAKENAPQFIEWKELRLSPGVDAYRSNAPLTLKARKKQYLKTLDWEREGVLISDYQVVEFMGKNYFNRPKWKCVTSLEESDFSVDEWLSVLKDEAMVIGRLHRKSLNKKTLDAYRIGFRSLAHSENCFQKFSELMKKIIKEFVD